MAESGAEKSRGLQFAERQLLRHGWEHGKGLGRQENGISEALKVKVKCGKSGVGHKEGEQFTFHWWDHVFNKTSASLEVQSGDGGTTLKKNTADDGGAISNKKPLKASLAKDKLYGAFVKSATLVSGQERAVVSASSSDSSSDEDDAKLDLSSTTRLSDAQLVKACGGRTAHKGARHGLNMNAKLARLEQQEAEFMARYGTKKQPEKEVTVSEENSPAVKEKKKKKKRKDCEGLGSEAVDVHTEEGVRKRKKKKKEDSVEEGIQLEVNDGLGEQEDHEIQPKKKKKKKKKEVQGVTSSVHFVD